MRASGSADLYRDGASDDIAAGFQRGSVTWQHPTSSRAQLRVEAAIGRLDNRFNDLQDARTYTLSTTLDRAFTPRFGGGLQVYGFREAARDPGYSTVTAGLSAYLFREVGRTTLVATAGYSHLEADRRLSLFARRRAEDRVSASLAATLPSLQVGSFAPLIRIRWERNKSPVEIYDYKRLAGEFGITNSAW